MLSCLLHGICTTHEKEFVTDHKSGRSYWVVMWFENDCMVYTVNGLERAKQGDMLIVSPDFREFQFTPEDAAEGYIDDWIHICSDDMDTVLKQYALPVNQLFYTKRTSPMREFLSEIAKEELEMRPFWREQRSCCIESMLIQIGRAHKEPDNAEVRQHYNKLSVFRKYLQQHLCEDWSVEKMAKQVSLSSSRFSVLYKQFFRESPNDSLIGMRLNEAKRLLITTDMPLQKISLECGFQNEFYFSRLFRAREGVPPGTYRREY